MGKDQELLEAARKGNTAVVEKILSQKAKRSGPLASLRRGPGANIQDSSGYTPLHHASLNGHAGIVRLLLGHDANPNVVDVKGSSALHLAAWSGHLEIVKLLLSGPAICNVNLTTKDDETALHCAAQYGHTDVVRVLLEHNSDPGIRNCKGETALDLAAQYGRLDTVELLVRTDPLLIQYLKRTLPDTVFPHTPLHLASRNGHRAVVEILLRAGFSANMKTKGGTALHEAALGGKVDVVRTLLEHGANPNIRDSYNYTVMDLLKVYYKTAPASQEICNILKRHGLRQRDHQLADSDVESVNNPFPPVPNTDSDLGSPYENVRPSSKSARSTATDPSPGTSPQRWECQTHPPPEGFQDRRVSGLSMSSNPCEGSYVDMTRSSALTRMNTVPKAITKHKKHQITFDDLSFTFKETLKSSLDGFYNANHTLDAFISCGRANKYNSDSYEAPNHNQDTNHYKENNAVYTTCIKNKEKTFFEGDSGIFSLKNSPSDVSVLKDGVLQCFENARESENSLYQIPGVPRQFLDGSFTNHPEDFNYLCTSRESDQISLSSTASSYSGYPRRPDSGGFTSMTARGSRSPGSGSSKVSPTPPKKPPRRAVPISPTHLQPMSHSVDGYSNGAYEYLFLSHTGTRSQDNLDKDRDGRESKDGVKRLLPCRSMDQYVEMNVFNIPVDEELPERPRSELQRGKSEDLDCRKKPEPVAITSYYENQVVRQQNPRRKLKRNEVYEEFGTFRRKKEDQTSSSAPETSFRSSAYIMITNNPSENIDSDSSSAKVKHSSLSKRNSSASAISSNSVASSNDTRDRDSFPISPTHYNQPPTPEHPPPTPMQAESVIYEKIRPLSQEYKRRSRDMETETEEEYLFLGDFESSGSFSSSISLSDRSVDNILEECHSDTPFSGLIRGSSTHILENLNMNIPAMRPKSLKKLRRVYDNSSNGDGSKSDNEISSSSEKETDNKENRERDKDRVSALSPFDEQEEWGKIQEIMASFGTGLVRESVFVAELEKEFQNRLMTISCSQNTLDNKTVANNGGDVEKWLQGLNMGEYASIFMSNGFDNLNFFNGVIEDSDLIDLGITSQSDRDTILNATKQLPLEIHHRIPSNCNNNETNLVKQWLKNINLEQHYETFDKHLYHDMERVKRIWDVELSAVLDIDKIGHRKRILASVSQGENVTLGPKLEEINADLNMMKPNNEPTKEIPSPSTQSNYSVNSNTGTIRHRHKKSRPAPQPPIKKQEQKYSEIHVGGSNSIKSRWRHQPILLITGYVKYSSKYWGSTTIKDFKGTESSKKSIQKVLKSKEYPLEDIVLSISYKGVKFVNPNNKNTICEHEIININHACQDDDQQSYFAYITQDNDLYYCHVFEALSSECATEIILTLGQAFELAYQMALRDQVTAKKPPNRDHRPECQKPAVSPGSVSSHSRDYKDSTRIADVKLNGHPMKMIPLTLSIAAEPQISGGSHKTPTKVGDPICALSGYSGTEGTLTVTSLESHANGVIVPVTQMK